MAVKHHLEDFLPVPFIEKDKDDFLFMLFHGILHIAGYDHKQKNDKIRMERKEKIIFSYPYFTFPIVGYRVGD